MHHSKRFGKQWTHRSDKEMQEHRSRNSQNDNAPVYDASDVHGTLTVRADEATTAKTQVTEACNAFFKSNDEHKELSAIAKALKAGFIDVTAEMNNIMKALNLIEMNDIIHQDYDFFDDVSDRLLGRREENA